jgi:hypothetical protein
MSILIKISFLLTCIGLLYANYIGLINEYVGGYALIASLLLFPVIDVVWEKIKYGSMYNG